MRRGPLRSVLAFPAAVAAVVLAALPAPVAAGRSPGPATTPSYSLYVGFAAQRACVPKDGPYLTKLGYDLHVPDVRFVFEARRLPGIRSAWSVVLGGEPTPKTPRLVFDTAGDILAELCPHVECDGRIEKAWFTKRSEQFDAVFQVVSEEERPDIMDELVNPATTGDLETDVVDFDPSNYVLYVHFIAGGRYAWTGECIVRHQDCGATSDLDFYLRLPASRLMKGEEVTLEFPFQTDDIDVPGVLTVRFIPTGSIKGL